VTDLKISGALGLAPVVINMSQGGTLPDAMELAAIDRAIANGIVCVAAAGNDADAGMHYPATYAPVISAGASGWVRQWPLDGPTIFAWVLRDVPEADVLEHFITPFSAWELPGRDLDVVAPGLAVAVPFTVDGSQVDYAYFGGTSAASPHLAGVAALMLQKNPGLSAGQVEAILEATAMPMPPDCRTTIMAFLGNGQLPSLGNQFFHAQFFPVSFCWGANVAGHGLLQAGAALAATPLP
jgi:subtilisin